MKPLPSKFLAAMIAVRALPGSPRYEGTEKTIIDAALRDLECYKQAGVDSIILENSHDLPYIKPPLPQDGIAVMKRLAVEVRSRFEGLLGIQMLEAANETALEIASHAGCDFLRVEGYVFAHVGGAGLIEGCAGHLLRRRNALRCEHIGIYADVKKKHCSHALTGDLDIAAAVRQSEFFLADGVVVTGPRTGEPPDIQELLSIREVARTPVLIGSGMTFSNIRDYLPLADGFIVGSTFRASGDFLGDLDPDRLKRFVEAFEMAKARLEG